VRRTIKCPMCGTPVPLPSGWKTSDIRSVSRHGSASRPNVLRVGDLVLDPATHNVSRAGKEIALSRTDFRLLKSLMRRSGRVVSRTALLHSVWDSNDDVNDNLIDVCIYQLRKKVDQNHKVRLIKTVPNFGYTIRDPAKALQT